MSKHPSRRAVALAAGAVLAGLLVAPAALAGEEIRHVRVGDSIEILLDGNPSTGYRWVLEKELGSGLGSVEVALLGYRGPAAGTDPQVVGAPEKFAIRITAIGPGQVHLVLGYRPPGGGPAARTHELRLDVAGG